MRHLTLILATVAILPVIFSCNTNTVKDRESIIRTEHEFAEMAGEKGIPDAFHNYAADSAVILRGGKLIKGKSAIRDYYLNNLKPGT